ncbi:MAG TPA: MFS transporter [Acidimicrobiales bacterium]|nr:MFS transporter [Acidimicrobiales bacterium]
MSRIEGLSWKAIRKDLVGVKALRQTKYGLTPVVVLTSMAFAQSFDSSLFQLLIPEIRRDLDLSLRTLGDLSTLTGLFALCFGPLVGFIADRTNRVRLMSISSVLSGLFSVVTARAGTTAGIFAARTIDDVSESLGGIPRGSLTFDYYPVEARGKMVAFQEAMGRLLGFTIGPAIGGLALLGGWRLPFYIAGPMLVASGLAGWLLLREPVRGYWERQHLGASDEVAEDAEPPPGWGESLRTFFAVRTLRRQIVGAIFSSLIAGAFVWLFQLFLAEQFGLNALQRGLMSIPTGLAGLSGVVLGGTIADILIRRRPSRVIVAQGAIGLVSVVFLVPMVLAPNVWVFIGLSLPFAFVSAALAPATSVVAGNVMPPRLRGLGIGIVGTVLAAVGQLAPSLAGRLSESYGLQGGMMRLVPLMVVAPVILISSAKFFEFDMRAAFASAMAKEEYRQAKDAGEVKLLVVKDLDVSYGSVQVLFNVDLTISEGEIVALLGTNGAGKSTVLRAISGIQEASNGAVLFDGRDITHLPPNEISKLGVATMPGGKGTFAGLTVQENLELALWNCPEDETEGRLSTVYGFFPVLQERLDQDAASLSGGEQQMVALGQAFCSAPRLLMIDELSLGLSPAIVGQLLEIVRAIRDQGTTVILVEQSVNVALTIAERAVFMEKGEVRFEGHTADLLARPDLMRAVYVRGAGALTATLSSAPRSVERMTAPRLEVTGASKNYGGKVAVSEVTFRLHDGEALGFVGPNGAGKTTLFDLISGYQQLDSGSIALEGVDVTNHAADARARAGLVRRFQDARLFGPLTVFETICVALEMRTEVRNTLLIAAQLPSARRSERRVRAAATRLVELFELGDYRDKFVSDLSTGLRRVVDLACVLAAEPKVLLLDEPSSGVAQAEAESLGPLLRRVRYETGCSLLIIEHDMALVRAVSDELVGMVEGRIVSQGPADEVLSDALLVAAYLGDKEETIQRQGQTARAGTTGGGR